MKILVTWAKEYPDVAGIVETIAEKKAKEMFDKANIQIEELSKAKEETTRKTAENEIKEVHKTLTSYVTLMSFTSG